MKARRFACLVMLGLLVSVGLGVTAWAVPSNDDVASASVVGSMPYTDSTSTVGATAEAGEPTPACGGSRNSVWYTYTHSGPDAFLRADTFGSDYDTVLAVYKQYGLPFGLGQEACNDDYNGLQSRIQISVAAGETYFIQVTGFATAEGNLVLNLSLYIPPLLANDDFANATVVTTLPFTNTVDTAAASQQPGEPPPSCGTSLNSTWYRYAHAASGSTAPLVDVITADTVGSNYDTVVAVYEGTSLASLTEVTCNDQAQGDQSQVIFEPEMGKTYYLQVTGWEGASGTLVFNMKIDHNCPPVAGVVLVQVVGCL